MILHNQRHSPFFYIHRREDLVDRVLFDIPEFDREKAEAEVDKFLLDAECLRIYLEFQKRKAEDPDFALPGSGSQEEGLFSFRNFVILYLGYVAYTSVPTAFRRFVETKQEAGEWNGSGFQFIDDWLEKSAADAVKDIPAADSLPSMEDVIPSADSLPSVDDIAAVVDVAAITNQASVVIAAILDASSGSLS